MVLRRSPLRNLPRPDQGLDPALLPDSVPQALVPPRGAPAHRGERRLRGRLRLPPAVPVPPRLGGLARLGHRHRLRRRGGRPLPRSQRHRLVGRRRQYRPRRRHHRPAHARALRAVHVEAQEGPDCWDVRPGVLVGLVAFSFFFFFLFVWLVLELSYSGSVVVKMEGELMK